MSSKQCFACLSILPSEVASKRGVASTLNNFRNEINDLMRISGRCGDGDKDNDKSKDELLQNLSVCSKCLSPVKLVVFSKYEVDKVESSVRKLQVDLLKQLRKLEECLEGLEEEMEVIGGIIQDSGGGETETGTDNQLTDDVWTFRKDILDVKGQLQMFRNSLHNSTSITANFPDSKKKPSNPSDHPPPQRSIKIKIEPKTNQLNYNNYAEDSSDLNLMEYDDHFVDYPPSDTEAHKDKPPSPEIQPDSSTDSPKSIPPTQPKRSHLPNKCTKCSKTFALKSDLQKHQKTNHPPNPNERLQKTVSCPHCHETMARQFLRAHKLHHCPSLKKNKPTTFPCSICKETFQNVKSLKEHNLEEHVEKLKYMCQTCGKISSSRQANRMHQNTHVDPRNRETVECGDCGKTILSTSVGSHLRLGCPKRENSSFLCKFCHNYFSNYCGLRKHIRNMHKGQPWDNIHDEEAEEKDPGGGPEKPIGHKRKIKVIAEEDNHDNSEDEEEDKTDDRDEMEDSDSEFVPSEDEVKKIKRKSRRGRPQCAPIKCPKCPRTFTWTRALQRHKIANHKNDWLSEQAECSDCLENMPRKLLRTHKLYHCPDKPKDIIYSCTLCKPSVDTETDFQQPIFADLQTLKSHVAAQHPNKMLTLICDICGQISASIQSHDKHQVRHVHPKNRQFLECEDCGKSILSTSVSSHQRFGCPKRERAKFPCVYCAKQFTTKTSVVRHVGKWHTGENGEFLLKPRRPKRLQCHLCGKWVQDKSAMKRHFRSRHQAWEERDDKSVCEFCGKQMLTVSLHQHEKYYCVGKEREEKGVTCEICGKGFRSLSIMQGHKKVVHGNERFVCELCGKVFRAKSNYKSHLVWHGGIRRFECGLGCGARFKQKSHLQRHTGLGYCRGEKGPRKQRRSNLEDGRNK